MDLFKEIRSVFLTKMMLFLLGAATSIIVARSLGPEGKGIVAVAFMLPILIARLGSFSIGSANVYLLGNRRELAKYIFSHSIFLSFLLCLIYFGLFLLFFNPLKGLFFRDIDNQFVFLGFLLLPLILVLDYLNHGILRGLHKFKQFNFTLIIRQSSYFMVLVLLLLLADLDVFKVMWATILGAGAAVIYVLVSITKTTCFNCNFHPGLLKEAFAFGLKEHLGNTAQQLNVRLDVLILAAYLLPSEIGYYTIAYMLAEIVWYIPDSIGLVLFPQVSSSDKEATGIQTARINRLALLLIIVVCSFLGLIGKVIISVIYGKAFLPAYPAMLFLLPGIAGLTVAKVLSKYISGIGKPLLTSTGSILGLILNIPLLILLVPRLGIIGASIASSVAYIAYAVYIIPVFIKKSGVSLRNTLVMNKDDITDILRHFKG